jgi:hypothetical protein
LLERVAKHPELVSLERMVKGRDGDLAWAKEDFAAMLGQPGEELSAAEVAEDRRHLEDDTKKVRRFATKMIAHYDEHLDKIQFDITWGELDQAIDIVTQTARKYQRLIADTDMPDVVLIPPWTDIFDVAWRDPYA